MKHLHKKPLVPQGETVCRAKGVGERQVQPACIPSHQAPQREQCDVEQEAGTVGAIVGGGRRLHGAMVDGRT